MHWLCHSGKKRDPAHIVTEWHCPLVLKGKSHCGHRNQWKTFITVGGPTTGSNCHVICLDYPLWCVFWLQFDGKSGQEKGCVHWDKREEPMKPKKEKLLKTWWQFEKTWTLLSSVKGHAASSHVISAFDPSWASAKWGKWLESLWCCDGHEHRYCGWLC